MKYIDHAIAYLARVSVIQNNVHAQMKTLADKVSTIANWRNQGLTTPQWKEMEAKLDHIYRTYVRL